jgi:hypothetical protein
MFKGISGRVIIKVKFFINFENPDALQPLFRIFFSEGVIKATTDLIDVKYNFYYYGKR